MVSDLDSKLAESQAVKNITFTAAVPSNSKKMQYFMIILVSDLESKLAESQSNRMRLIVTDGVFSMDGNVAPLG